MTETAGWTSSDPQRVLKFQENRLSRQHFGHEMSAVEIVENEDWGRDYVLQQLLRHSSEELRQVGLTREPMEESDN